MAGVQPSRWPTMWSTAPVGASGRGNMPRLQAEPEDWYHRAACRGEDPDLFFPVGTSPEAVAQEREAKAICAACPVRAECRGFALRTGQEAGVWGGLGEDERRGERAA